MGYLLPTEYLQYGLTEETTDDWIALASALMDSFCHRASLLSMTYVERMRLTTGAQTVRLSYLPLGTLQGVRVRYGRPAAARIRTSSAPRSPGPSACPAAGAHSTSRPST